MKQLLVLVEEEQHEWVRREAFERKTTMGDIVRKLICGSMGDFSEEDEE